ncbi:hypothetical protein H9P43_000242 [Blastocladiella emersonii ATCC 22665]|nr:hypothetical protein H9P43_000242 [Blastocladiella emersonii ATCC 22665]
MKLLQAVLVALVAFAATTSTVSAQIIDGNTPINAPIAAPPTTGTPATNGVSCGNGADTTFAACLANAATIIQANCESLRVKQGFEYFDCMCKQVANKVACYDQCPGQAGQKQIAQSEVTAFCASADSTRPKSSTTTATTSATRSASASASASASTGSAAPASTSASAGAKPTTAAAAGTGIASGAAGQNGVAGVVAAAAMAAAAVLA